MVNYYKMQQILLQNATAILLQNASGFLVQNATVLLQNATVITKCDVYCILRQYIHFVLSITEEYKQENRIPCNNSNIRLEFYFLRTVSVLKL